MNTLNLMRKAAINGPLTQEEADEIKARFMLESPRELIRLAQTLQRLGGRASKGEFVPAPLYIEQAFTILENETLRNELLRHVERATK